MGLKLLQYYEWAKSEGGLEAQMKLAMITCCSSQKAKDAPDSNENLLLFEDAFKKMKADLQSKKA